MKSLQDQKSKFQIELFAKFADVRKETGNGMKRVRMENRRYSEIMIYEVTRFVYVDLR